MAIRALFTRADIKSICDEFLDRVILATVEALKDVGEAFITDCRDIRTYKDQTGNLRSSCGYLIMVNGRIVQGAFDAGTSGAGRRKGRDYARKIALQFPGNRILFVGVAGMEYAVYVEANGLDVITGSSLSAKKLLQRHIKRILKK
jgi:hypothetical protein